jgi:hypothetical protein
MIPVKMGKDDDFDFIQSDAQTLKLFVNGLPRVLAPLMMVFLGSFGIAHAGVHQYFAPVAFNQKSKYGVFDNFAVPPTKGCVPAFIQQQVSGTDGPYRVRYHGSIFSFSAIYF